MKSLVFSPDTTAAQRVFNTIGLPVTMRSDSQGTHVQQGHSFSPEPGLVALNRYLENTGRNPIDINRMIEPALIGLQPPAAALQRDLATRSRPFFHFNLNDVTHAQDKEVLDHLLSAAALMDTFYRIQVEPQFISQFQAVVEQGNPYAVAHFWMRGHLGAIEAGINDSDEIQRHTFPEGQRNLNGVWWPDDFTIEDIQSIEGQLSGELKRKVFGPLSRLIEASADEEDVFEHNGKLYRPAPLNSHPELNLIGQFASNHIQLAANLLRADYPEFAAMLDGRSRAIFGAELFSDFQDDQLWVGTHHPRISFAVGPGERSKKYGNPFGYKYLFYGLVGYSADAKSGTFADQMMALTKQAHERLVQLWRSHGEEPPFATGERVSPVLDLVEKAFPFGHNRSAAYVAAGFNRPNNDVYSHVVARKDMATRLVLLNEVMKSRLQGQGLPMAREVFGDSFAQKLESMLTDSGMIASVLAHEIAHSDAVDQNVPIHIPGYDQPISIEEALSDSIQAEDGIHPVRLVMGYEEGKADILGVERLAWYQEQGVLSESDRQSALATYILSLLRNFYIGAPEIHALGAIYQWKFLVDAGVIDLSNKNKPVDFEMLEQKLPDLVKSFNELYGQGIKDDMLAHHRESLALIENSSIGAAKAKLEQRGVPKMDNPRIVLDGWG